MKKPPVGAGPFCPLSILVFYIPPCWKYFPVPGARPSPCCNRKFITSLKSKLPEIRRIFHHIGLIFGEQVFFNCAHVQERAPDEQKEESKKLKLIMERHKTLIPRIQVL
jgi:hypothetical protein